jgi:hypothetical protein
MSIIMPHHKVISAYQNNKNVIGLHSSAQKGNDVGETTGNHFCFYLQDPKRHEDEKKMRKIRPDDKLI